MNICNNNSLFYFKWVFSPIKFYIFAVFAWHCSFNQAEKYIDNAEYEHEKISADKPLISIHISAFEVL